MDILRVVLLAAISCGALFDGIQARAESQDASQTAPDATISGEVSAVATVQQRYAIEIEASNTRLQVRVNDVPVAFKVFRDRQTIDVAFNEWIKAGTNTIDVQMDRFDGVKPYTAKFNVYFQSPTQVIHNQRGTLYSSPHQLSLPLRQTLTMKSSNAVRLRVWDAEKIEMDDDEKDRLITDVNSTREQMMTALSKGDNAFLATFDKPIRDEIDIAYGRTPQTDEELLKQRTAIALKFRELVNASVVASPEIDEDSMRLDMIANGHLVRVMRLDGAPVIDVTRGGLRYTINNPIYGLIGGLWVLLRNP